MIVTISAVRRAVWLLTVNAALYLDCANLDVCALMKFSSQLKWNLKSFQLISKGRISRRASLCGRAQCGGEILI